MFKHMSFRCHLKSSYEMIFICTKVGAPYTKTSTKTNTLEILLNKYMLIRVCSACEHQGSLLVLGANTVFTSKFCIYFNK